MSKSRQASSILHTRSPPPVSKSLSPKNSLPLRRPTELVSHLTPCPGIVTPGGDAIRPRQTICAEAVGADCLPTCIVHGGLGLSFVTMRIWGNMLVMGPACLPSTYLLTCPPRVCAYFELLGTWRHRFRYNVRFQRPCYKPSINLMYSCLIYHSSLTELSPESGMARD